MKIKKGDTVRIQKGKDRGKSGKVDRVMPRQGKIIVTGVNLYKKHLKPSRKNPQGGILDYNAPISATNAMVICPRCNKATRIGYKITEKSKLRICKKCKESIDVAA